MNELIEKLKKAIADGTEGDDLAAIWTEITEAANTTAAALDALAAEKKTATDKATALTTERDQLKTQLEAAGGDSAEALAKAQKQLEAANGQISDMKTTAAKRAMRDKARAALTDAKVAPARVDAALQLLNLDGVSVGDDGALVGHKAKIADLKKRHSFLWESSDKKDKGDTGKRGDDSDKKDGKPDAGKKTQAEKNSDLGKLFAESTFAKNRGSVRGKTDEGSKKAS